jgi:hypothetical protein
MATPATVLAVWNMINAGLISLDVLSIQTVDLGEPENAVKLAAAASGLDFVVLIPDASAGAAHR